MKNTEEGKEVQTEQAGRKTEEKDGRKEATLVSGVPRAGRNKTKKAGEERNKHNGRMMFGAQSQDTERKGKETGERGGQDSIQGIP